MPRDMLVKVGVNRSHSRAGNDIGRVYSSIVLFRGLAQNCNRNKRKFLYVFVKKRAAFVCFCQKESGPRVVKSGHGPDRSLARARARPPMRAVPRCRTRVSSRRSSGYQESQWILRGLSALHKQPRPPLRCDKRQGHRETKRAPSGKWNGRRVENDGNFGAQ